MKNLTRILILVLLVSAILIPSTVSASGFEDDKVIFGSNYTLREGETLDGDLIVLGGNVTLERSSTVNGDTVVFGGNVNVNGTINGNLVALGGIVALGEEALITGDLTVVSGTYDQAPGAVITGDIVTEENIPFEFDLPENGLFEGDFPIPRFNQLPFVSASWFFFRVLIWTGLAILIGLFLEDPAKVINKAALGEPVMTFVVGLGVIVVAPFVLLALIVTILLSPVSLVGIFALIAAWVIGLVALSIEVGRKLVEALNQTLPVPLLAGIGMFIISLIFNGFSQLVPCVGWLPKFILGSWVMGAVILTRFGTRAYPAAKDQPVEGVISPAVDPAPVAEIPEAFPGEEPVNATQSALDLAAEEGIDLSSVTGTGAEGRITLNDVRKAVKAKKD